MEEGWKHVCYIETEYPMLSDGKFGPELWSEPKPIQLDAPGHQFRVWVWGLTWTRPLVQVQGSGIAWTLLNTFWMCSKLNCLNKLNNNSTVSLSSVSEAWVLSDCDSMNVLHDGNKLSLGMCSAGACTDGLLPIFSPHLSTCPSDEQHRCMGWYSHGVSKGECDRCSRC